MTKIETKAYFDSDIKPKIIELLQTAKQEVFVASAWFNDEDLYNALLSLPRNVKTSVLIKKDDETNKLDWKNLGDNNIGVYQLLEENGTRSLMHHKFCTIDNHTVITGSYNWTNGAKSHNHENIVVIEGDEKLNFQYKEQFSKLIQTIEEELNIKLKELENQEAAIINKIKTHADLIRDYIRKYKEIPPKQLIDKQFNEQYSTTTNDIGKGIVVYGNTVTTYGTSLSTSEEKKDWWENKLSSDLKSFFNAKKFQISKNNKQYPGDAAIDNLLELKSLYVKDVANADGIEYLVNLTELFIESNRISSLPDLSKLKSLTCLNISDSYYISELPHIKNLIFLKTLVISSTQINSLENIPFLENLTFLSCYETPIISLNGIEKLPNLEKILCHVRYGTLPNEKKRLENLGFSFQERKTTIDKKVFDTWINEKRITKNKQITNS